MSIKTVVGTTESVCPECLERIPAQKVTDNDGVHLIKVCPKHGRFSSLIWQGMPEYQSWANTKIPSSPSVCATGVEKGCPYDCGLCPEHRQQTCCVLLEITNNCNLHCPICFAAAENGLTTDPDLAEIENWYLTLLESGGPYNIQLSGGEPTLRDDLPEIIQMGRELGFNYIQLNTNGLRLGQEPHFVQQLSEAGLSSVFLQFDGTSDEIYKQIRGAALFDLKMAAINNCAQQGIGVVLVPTLVPGVNMDDIGHIINLAISHMPAVRGVHFQPISYFGRYHKSPPPDDRITIPEIIRAIDRQTGGRIKPESFLPPGAENAYCSFHGNFILMPDGLLKSWTHFESNKSCCKPIKAAESVERTREFVAKYWSAPKNGCEAISFSCDMDKKISKTNEDEMDSLDEFLSRIKDYTLCISGMAFQDVWTLDLERLRDCIVHVLAPDKKLIPFCAYNLTARNGKSLYRL